MLCDKCNRKKRAPHCDDCGDEITGIKQIEKEINGWRNQGKNDWLNKKPCLHDSCPACQGSGQRLDGNGMCAHSLSCNCPKCGLYS